MLRFFTSDNFNSDNRC